MIRELVDDATGSYAQVIYGVPFMPPVILQVWVPAQHRREGVGGRLLEAAAAFGLRHGDEVLLAPIAERGGPTQDELEAWYGRHGFEWQPNRNMMVRRRAPQPSAARSVSG